MKNDFDEAYFTKKLEEVEEKYLEEVEKKYNVTITLLSKISVPMTVSYMRAYSVKYKDKNIKPEETAEETIQYEENILEKPMEFLEFLEKIKEMAMSMRLSSELNEVVDKFETVEKLDRGCLVKFLPYKSTSLYSEGIGNVVEVCSVPTLSIMIIPCPSTDTFFLHDFASQDYLKNENYYSLHDIVEKVRFIKNIRDIEREYMINP